MPAGFLSLLYLSFIPIGQFVKTYWYYLKINKSEVLKVIFWVNIDKIDSTKNIDN